MRNWSPWLIRRPGPLERLVTSLGASPCDTDPAELFADPDSRGGGHHRRERGARGPGHRRRGGRARRCSARSRWDSRSRRSTAVFPRPARPASHCRSGSTAASPRTSPPPPLIDRGRDRRAAADALADPRPGRLANPAAVPPGTIFVQTLIHDFDTLLWLNPGAKPVDGVRHRRRPRRAGVQERGGCWTPRSWSYPLRNGADRRGRGQLLRDVRVRRARRGLRFGRHGHGGRHDPASLVHLTAAGLGRRHRPRRRRAFPRRLHG